MSANFYSLRNMLEAGEIRDRDKNNQFLTAVITSYPCLDIWVRVADDRNLDIRVMYMQKDPDYVATRGWQRDGENPKVWKQYQGDWQASRDWFIGVLTDLSRLSDEKRHGLHTFGGANPYDGGGMIVNNNNDGSFTVLGRFGLLDVTVDGLTMPFSAVDWSFDGCEVTAVIPPPDQWPGGGGGGGGGGGIVIIDRPVQNMTGSRYEFNPSVTLTYQYGMGGYERYAGEAGFGADVILGTVGYLDETQHGPPTFLSPTNIPNYNNTSPVPGWTGLPSNLMDSYYGEINGIVNIPLVLDDGTTQTYRVQGEANVIRWTKTHSTWEGDGTDYSGATNEQGLAVATAEPVPGVWTVTKTVNGSQYDWTWGFVADNPGPSLSFTQTSLTTGNQVIMSTNGGGLVKSNNGVSVLNEAQANNLVGSIQNATVSLDAENSGPGFVINGDRTIQETVGDSNVGLVLKGDASFGAITIA